MAWIDGLISHGVILYVGMGDENLRRGKKIAYQEFSEMAKNSEMRGFVVRPTLYAD